MPGRIRIDIDLNVNVKENRKSVEDKVSESSDKDQRELVEVSPDKVAEQEEDTVLTPSIKTPKTKSENTNNTENITKRGYIKPNTSPNEEDTDNKKTKKL